MVWGELDQGDGWIRSATAVLGSIFRAMVSRDPQGEASWGVHEGEASGHGIKGYLKGSLKVNASGGSLRETA